VAYRVTDTFTDSLLLPIVACQLPGQDENPKEEFSGGQALSRVCDNLPTCADVIHVRPDNSMQRLQTARRLAVQLDVGKLSFVEKGSQPRSWFGVYFQWHHGCFGWSRTVH